MFYWIKNLTPIHLIELWMVRHKVITKGVMSRCPLDNPLLASWTSVILWRFVMLANIRAPEPRTHMNKTRAGTLPSNSNIMLYVPTMRKQSTIVLVCLQTNPAFRLPDVFLWTAIYRLSLLIDCLFFAWETLTFCQAASSSLYFILD